MEYRKLGDSGLRVPVLSLGTGTFGGEGPLFSAWGSSGVQEARRLVDICLDAGANLFDSADVYSNGAAEEILGAAIQSRRDRVLISTKIGLPTGPGAHEAGNSRARLLGAVNAALRRLGTEYIDLLQLHAFDSLTPIEETLYTLDLLVRSGKVRYLGASNFSGWQLMKSLGLADRYGWPRYVAHQIYYSLLGRDYEWELMPLGIDQKVGALVWSPLGWGRLTGKIRRGQPLPKESRLHATAQWGPAVDPEQLYRVVDALEAVAGESEDGAAGRHRLAPDPADGLIRHPRCPERISATRQLGGRRLDSQARADQAPRCCQRRGAAVSVLPLSRAGGFRPAEPVASLTGLCRRFLS